MLCVTCSASRHETARTRWTLSSRMWTREVSDGRRRTFLSSSYARYCTRIIVIVSYWLKYTSIRRICSVLTNPDGPSSASPSQMVSEVGLVSTGICGHCWSWNLCGRSVWPGVIGTVLYLIRCCLVPDPSVKRCMYLHIREETIPHPRTKSSHNKQQSHSQ